MAPRPGETVLVPTSVKAGAFPGEKLVTVNTEGGVVSGFARDDSIVEQGNGQYILAEVKKVVSSQILTVKLAGSFFTTTGLADISSSLVRKATG